MNNEPFPEDPLADWIVTTYQTFTATVCRVCLQRNAPETPVVVVAGPNRGAALSADPSKEKPLRIVTALCMPCYEVVRKDLTLQVIVPEMKLPSLNSLKLRDRYDDGAVYYKLEHRTFDDARLIIGLSVNWAKERAETNRIKELAGDSLVISMSPVCRESPTPGGKVP